MLGQGPTMPRMGITHVVAIVLTWITAGAQPPAERTAMLQEADAIWGAHGVSIVAVAPEQAGPPAADARLVVALARASRPPAAPGRRERLGAIVFDHDNAPATTITIDVAAVAAIVARARLGGRPFDQWPPAGRDALVGRALGRVLAHEIGHYLLASRVHTSAGLMRAAFDGDELVRPGRGGFGMAARDLPRLRLRLAGLGGGSTLAENAR
jgi:hypothetical protein